jgi:hypothetical protein
LSIKAKETDKWNKETVFENLESVSNFFEEGAIGYSPNRTCFNGLELKAQLEVSFQKVL